MGVDVRVAVGIGVRVMVDVGVVVGVSFGDRGGVEAATVVGVRVGLGTGVAVGFGVAGEAVSFDGGAQLAIASPQETSKAISMQGTTRRSISHLFHISFRLHPCIQGVISRNAMGKAESSQPLFNCLMSVCGS